MRFLNNLLMRAASQTLVCDGGLGRFHANKVNSRLILASAFKQHLIFISAVINHQIDKDLGLRGPCHDV